jgi:hypothetical protein
VSPLSSEQREGNLARYLPPAGTQAARAGEVQGTDYQGRVLYAGWVTMEGKKCLGLESESRLAVFFHDWSGCADHHTSFLLI